MMAVGITSKAVMSFVISFAHVLKLCSDPRAAAFGSASVRRR